MCVISSVLDGVKFGAKLTHQSLTLFPVQTGDGGDMAYLRLAEAMASGLARASEVSEGGSVPNLHLENSASLPVLIVDGEEALPTAVLRRPMIGDSSRSINALNSNAALPPSSTD